MKSLSEHLEEISTARSQFLVACSNLSFRQASFKPTSSDWSISEIAEHLVWAERIGVMGMWKAHDGIKNGEPIWTGENPNKSLSMEELVGLTWQEKEIAPAVAEPKWGGTLAYWLASLEACAHPLVQLCKALENQDLHEIVYPHPISGPLHVAQRLDFLRFHLDRHKLQVQKLKQHPGFPPF